MKTILCLFLSLFSISAFSSDLHQLAHSKKLGIKVLVETKDNKWCSSDINMHFKADKATFFQGQDAQLLMSKLSKIIEPECPSLEKSNIVGYTLNPDSLLLEAVASKQNNWKIINKKAERQSISLDSLESVPEKAVKKENKISAASMKPIEANTAQAKQTSGNGKLDILGIQLGMSPKEVEKVLKEIKFKLSPVKKELLSYTTGGGFSFPKRIPNTEYIRYMDASPIDSKIKDRLKVYFAAPPNNREVLYINREKGYYQNGPSMMNLLSALEQKYNKPTHCEYDRDYSWLLSGNKEKKTACTYLGGVHPSTNNILGFERLISDGCGLTLNIKIDQKKGVVRNMKQALFDGFMLNKYTNNVEQFLGSYKEKLRQNEMQKANAVAVPNL